MIRVCVDNEFSPLKKVVLGISTNFGACPTLEEAYDPKSKENIINKTFPKEKDIKEELGGFLNILKSYDVEVFRPQNIFDCNQIFTRDVGFVIEDSFFISNMLFKRKREILGFDLILKQVNSSKINYIPSDVFVEGGDVVVSENYIFLGYSNDTDFHRFEVSRTNKEALIFFKHLFPNKKIIGFELNKSDIFSLDNCLHLDCCFQPLGLGHVIVYPEGFKNASDLELINNIFGNDNIIRINKQEMSNMFSNIFSISHNIVVSEERFSRLNNILINKGYIVEEIPFSEISKMGGLLRCTTLPLIRSHD